MVSPRRFPVVQLDVFTACPLQGNPLAVFTDARGLTGEEMQALAREMNLSETTFVLPRDAATERDRGVRVRIFTVEEELPFAGHYVDDADHIVAVPKGAAEVGVSPWRRTVAQGEASGPWVIDTPTIRLPLWFRLTTRVGAIWPG
jgi:PhzF family phenazine biosynthesis protein